MHRRRDCRNYFRGSVGQWSAYITPTREGVLDVEFCNTLIIWWARQDSNLGPRDYEYPCLIALASESRRSLNAFLLAFLLTDSDRSYHGRSAEIRGRVSLKNWSFSSSYGSEPTEPDRVVDPVEACATGWVSWDPHARGENVWEAGTLSPRGSVLCSPPVVEGADTTETPTSRCQFFRFSHVASPRCSRLRLIEQGKWRKQGMSCYWLNTELHDVLI